MELVPTICTTDCPTSQNCTFPQYPIDYLGATDTVNLDPWCAKQLLKNIHLIECPYVTEAYYVASLIRVCGHHIKVICYPYVRKSESYMVEKIFKDYISNGNLTFSVFRKNFRYYDSKTKKTKLRKIAHYGMLDFLEDYPDQLKDGFYASSNQNLFLDLEELNLFKVSENPSPQKEEKIQIYASKISLKKLQQMNRTELYTLSQVLEMKKVSKLDKSQLLEQIKLKLGF